MNIRQLRNAYPNVEFFLRNSRFHPRNEDATYFGTPPQGYTEEGVFIRMENRHGGTDTVSYRNQEELLRLAQWHNER